MAGGKVRSTPATLSRKACCSLVVVGQLAFGKSWSRLRARPAVLHGSCSKDHEHHMRLYTVRRARAPPTAWSPCTDLNDALLYV